MPPGVVRQGHHPARRRRPPSRRPLAPRAALHHNLPMRARARHHGFSLAEALIAATILGFALLVGLGVVLWADGIEERAEERTAAVELAASVAERVRAAPYGLVASGELDLAGETLPPLPEPVVVLEVTEDPDLWLKTVGVVVTWAGEHPGKLRVETKVGASEIYR